jgi:hypothetical protein
MPAIAYIPSGAHASAKHTSSVTELDEHFCFSLKPLYRDARRHGRLRGFLNGEPEVLSSFPEILIIH